MKKPLLIGGGVVGVVVVVAIVAVVFFLSNLDSIVKAAIEQVGSEVTQTTVKLDDVEISLAGGKGSLRGFRMRNPQGFSDNDVFKFNEISVTLDIATVQNDPIVIKEILIDSPEITYELGGTKSNIDTVKDNVAKSAPKKGGDSGGDSGSAEGPKFVIENLILRNGRVSVTATELLGESISAPLPPIHLKNIGKKDNGASPSEIATVTMNSVLDKVAGAVAAVDISKLTDQLKNINVEGAGKVLEEGTEGATKAVEGVGKSLKGLFDKKD